MRTKIYLTALLALFCIRTGLSQHDTPPRQEGDRHFFNESYWKGIVDKRQLSTADRQEFLDAKRREFEGLRDHHRTFADSELVWVEVPVTGKKLGGASTYTGPCTNIDFESGNLNGWVRKTGFHPLWNTTGCCPNPNGAQAIMTGTGLDPYGAFPIVAPGGNFSVRLGNNALQGIADRLEQTFSVTPQNANFTYRYAVVLNDQGHPLAEQPAFTIEMIDSTGFQVPCTMYTVAAASNIPGFLTSSVTGGSPLTTVVYKPWTTVALDLTPSMGQVITIRFTTYDCAQGGHFGYAYIDGSCNSFQTNIADTTCPGVPFPMCGPAGYYSYFWSGPNSFTSTAQCINVTDPGVYHCQTVLQPGCPGPTFNHTLTLLPKPVLSFTPATTGPCALQYTFTSSSSIAPGSSIATYTWNFGDNNSTFLQSPAHNYATFGTYPVKFKAISDKGCSDSVVQAVTIYPLPNISYSPPSNCVNTIVQFTNTSTIPNPTLNSIVSYTWNLGNGVITNAINPTNTYSASGPFNVTLTAMSNQGCVSSLSSTLGIFPPPVISFTANNFCDGDNTAFTSTTTIASGSLVAFNWDFGDGSTASTPHPSRTFTAPGNYVVTFSATSNHNCLDTETKTITINPNPVASFTQSSVCLNIATTFTNTSTIAFPYSVPNFTWNFGNGNLSNAVHPVFTFTTAGLKTTTLTAESNSGCRSTAVYSVTIHPLPQIAFSPPGACANTAIQFTNTSQIASGAITSYSWNFGNGNTTTSVNPVYAYTVGGTYFIDLTATSDQNCTTTANHTLVIYPEPIADFSVSNGCQSSVLQFANNSQIASPDNIPFYNWDFGNGGVSSLPNPSFSYTNAGNFVVNLTATSNHGCVDSHTAPVTVYPLPTVAVLASSVCPGFATTFTNSTSGALTYSWNFGDGSPSGGGLSPIHNYTATNNYLVQLTAISNQSCLSTGTAVAVVYPHPNINFSPPGACQGSAINFTNTSSIAYGNIASYFWEFGNGVNSTSLNPSYSYPQHGIYNVTLTATSDRGCIATKVTGLPIYPVPFVTFSETNKCFGDTTKFSGNWSIAPGDTVLFHNWYLGDGFYAGGQTPKHVYASSNTFAVTYSATSSNNCVSAFTKTITINPVPQITFSANSVCLGNASTFTNNSSIPGATNTINQWLWDFGDNTTSSQQVPNHNYGTFGTFNAVLSATSNLGCKSTATTPVVVHPLPSVAFSPSSACVGATIQFTNNTTIPLGSMAGYTWNLGNNVTSNQVNPVHTYSVPNNYIVSLSAVSDMGCMSSNNTTSLGIHPFPQVNVTPLSNGCLGDPVTFNSNIVLVLPPGLPSSITTHTWNFGNGNFTIVNSPTVGATANTYSTYGSYQVILSAITNQGCQTDDTTNVTIYPKPNPGFVVQKFCHKDSTSFINTSTIPTGTITSHLWYFNDGIATSTLKDPKHMFTSPNVYTVLLSETSNPEPGLACTNTVANSVTINPLPQPAFSWSPVCFGTSMAFSNNTPTTGIVGWTWDFENDGQSNSSGFNSSHTYSASGIYTVNLRAQNNFSCVNVLTQTVQVYSNPTASFAASGACFRSFTSFTNLSTPGDANNITLYKWKFSPTDSSLLAAPQVSLAAPGIQTVELYVQTSLGCSSKHTGTVQVHHLPVVDFSTGETCEGGQTQFTNLSNIADGSQLLYRWDYMNNGWDDSSATYAIDPHVYPGPGGYTFKLEATTPQGCKDSKVKTVVVYANPNAAFNTNRVCVGDNIVFTNLSTSGDGSITAYVWDFNGDDIADRNELNPSFTYTLNGNFETKLTVITQFGCTDTKAGFIYANPKAVPAYRSDKTTGCPPLCVNFQDLSTISSGTFTTSWNFGDLSPSITGKNPNHCFNTGAYDLQLELVTDSGCVSSLSHPAFVTVYENPKAGFNIYPDEIDEDEPNITVENAADNVKQTKYFINDGTTYNTPDFAHNIKNFDGKSLPLIVQIVTNEQGCSDTTFKLIKIKPAFAIYVPDAFTPNGDGVNDEFFAKGVGIVEFEMKIYDRWGHLLFTATDFNQKWDGRSKSSDGSIKQDVYTWKAEVLDIHRKKHQLVGHVTLIN